MSLLQIYQWVCQWKNFENRLTFGEVMGKSLVSCFFLRHSVHIISHITSMSILTNFPCQNQILWAFVRFLLSGVSICPVNICPGEHMSVNHSVPAHGAGFCTFSHPSVLNASIFQQIEFILGVCFLHKSSYFLSYVSASSALPSCSYSAAVGIKVCQIKVLRSYASFYRATLLC